MPLRAASQNAIVLLANYYQFDRGQRILLPEVYSRMLLWGKAGQGEVRVNGERLFGLGPGDFLFLPWKHAIEYRAGRAEPFLVAGIHIVPRHEPRRRIVYRIPHSRQDALSRSRWRSDVALPGLSGIRHGRFARNSALEDLAEYTVKSFRPGGPREWRARNLAQLLLAELHRYFHDAGPGRGEIPRELQQMLQYVENHISQKLSLNDLSRFSGLSRSRVGRLFKRGLGVTPVAWITRAKMDAARGLLAASRLAVGRIGRRVGIEDPYYFSKLFKKTCGLSPLAYRKKTSLL